MPELAGGDEDGRAGHKSRDHRVGHEIDHAAEPGQPEAQFDDPGQEGQGQDQVQVFGRARGGQLAHVGEDDERGRGGRAGDEVERGAEKRGHHHRHHGRVQAVFRRQAGDGGEGHALGQDDHRPGQAGPQVGLERSPVDLRPPAKKREQARQGLPQPVEAARAAGQFAVFHGRAPLGVDGPPDHTRRAGRVKASAGRTWGGLALLAKIRAGLTTVTHVWYGSGRGAPRRKPFPVEETRPCQTPSWSAISTAP